MPYVDTSSWRGSCKQGLYIALPILHGLSAIAALVMCFYCDVGRIRHQARTPGVVPYPIDTRNISAQLFLAAYPWAEDDEFVTHTWNPFALVATFQWLTAGFALRTVMGPAWNGVISTVWCVWLSLGYGLYATWSFTSFGGPFCVAMFATITASYIAAFVLCLMFVGPPSLSVLYHGGVVYAKVPPGDSDGKSQLKPGSDSTLAVWTGEDGRAWMVPRAVKALKTPGTGRDGALPGKAPPMLTMEQSLGVIYRYAEYCITAPLLFIAVVCLMVVDAPAWYAAARHSRFITRRPANHACHHAQALPHVVLAGARLQHVWDHAALQLSGLDGRQGRAQEQGPDRRHAVARASGPLVRLGSVE